MRPQTCWIPQCGRTTSEKPWIGLEFACLAAGPPSPAATREFMAARLLKAYATSS